MTDKRKTLKDHEPDLNWQLYELKTIDMILMEYEGYLRPNGGYEFENEGWTINDEMLPLFGNGEEHYFYRLDGEDENEPDEYTHRANDGWFYSEKWFEEIPIIKFDEGDFLL